MATEKVTTKGAGGKSHKRRGKREDVKEGARVRRRREDAAAEGGGRGADGDERCTGGCGNLVEDCGCEIDEDGEPMGEQCKDGAEHEIDWDTLQSAGNGLVDVWCKKCGKSGSTQLDASDISFG